MAAKRKKKTHRPLAPESTSCACCAAAEDRPWRLTLTADTARRLMYVANKHEAHAERGVKGDDLMVFVDTTAIVAELIAREAKRMRGGGRLPRMRRPAVRVKALPPVKQPKRGG
jgi:hypothetical protein